MYMPGTKTSQNSVGTVYAFGESHMNMGKMKVFATFDKPN